MVCSEVAPLTCGMVRSAESGMPGSAGTFSMTVCVSTAITPAAGTQQLSLSDYHARHAHATDLHRRTRAYMMTFTSSEAFQRSKSHRSG